MLVSTALFPTRLPENVEPDSVVNDIEVNTALLPTTLPLSVTALTVVPTVFALTVVPVAVENAIVFAPEITP